MNIAKVDHFCVIISKFYYEKKNFHMILYLIEKNFEWNFHIFNSSL